MKAEQNNEQLKRETKAGIRRVGDIRKRLSRLEQRGIPEQHQEYEDLRDEIEILLDHLLEEGKVDIETSSLIRQKLKRIEKLFVEMEADGHFSSSLDAAAQLHYDKEKQDSKLAIVQLMLSQIFPKLKEGADGL